MTTGWIIEKVRPYYCAWHCFIYLIITGYFPSCFTLKYVITYFTANGDKQWTLSILSCLFVKTYHTAMLYFTRFLTCSHIPPTGDKMIVFVSNTNGTVVFLVTQNWYFERRLISPTFVCISPNRIPEIETNSS